MPSEETAGRRGPPHTGGGEVRRSQAVEAVDSSSASAAHEEAASRGRTSVMSRQAGRRRSTRTAADRSGINTKHHGE